MAKQDPDALFGVAKWAESQGLVADAKRILQAVLKLKPEHEGANMGLGNELFEGTWLSAKDASAARKKAMEAQFKAKGMVELGGLWVEKEHVADAKLGVFHHDGDSITKEEKLAFSSGLVRHPITGEFISARYLEQAKNRLFPVGAGGRWVDERDADDAHKDPATPWIVRGQYCTLVSSLPIVKLEQLREIADRGIDRTRPLLQGMTPRPTNRPTIVVAGTVDEYRAFGARIGDATSAYFAFLATEEATVRVPYHGDIRPAVCNWDKDWGPYALRHAAAIANLSGLCAQAGVDVPLWFLHGVGSVANYFFDQQASGWLAERCIQKGGLKELKTWFVSFTLNGEMEFRDLEFNVFQAGLLLAFASEGGDTQAAEAMKGVTAAFVGGSSRGIEKAIEKLKTTLLGKEVELRAYLQGLVRKRTN